MKGRGTIKQQKKLVTVFTEYLRDTQNSLWGMTVWGMIKMQDSHKGRYKIVDNYMLWSCDLHDKMRDTRRKF